MDGGFQGDATAHALSALRWWSEAGVDMLVDESPRDWLAPAAPPSAPAETIVAPPPDPLPATLDALTAWLADPQTFPALGARRFAPVGDPAGGLMLFTDMPEREDGEALFEGPCGRLLDGMLAAIGRDRVSVYLVPFAPARPAGRLDAALAADLTAAARRHIALAAPRHVLLLGELVTTALLGQPFAAARRRLHDLNHGDGTVTALATYHPRFLLERPARKADAWSDLRLLIEDFGR